MGRPVVGLAYNLVSRFADWAQPQANASVDYTNIKC